MKPEITDKFYCISWPQSQTVKELDPEGVHWSAAHNDETLFVEAEWFDQQEENCYTDFEKAMLDFHHDYTIVKGYADKKKSDDCLKSYKDILLSIAGNMYTCLPKWRFARHSVHEAPHVLKRPTGDNPVKEYKYALYFGKHYIDIDDLMNLPKEQKYD